MSNDQRSTRYNGPLIRRRQALGFGAAAVAGLTLPRSGHSATAAHWSSVSGFGNDIAIGANGTRVIIGAGSSVGGDWPVYRQSNGAWIAANGSGKRIACQLDGNIWVVNAASQIFFGTFDPGTFTYSYTLMPGTALDIGVGWDGMTGSVWRIGTDSTVSLFNSATMTWNAPAVPGAGSRIAADPLGNPWLTTASNQIWTYNVSTSTWTQVPGFANDIGVGGNGAVWVIGAGPVSGGGWPIYENSAGDPVNPNWQQILGEATNIAVDLVGSAIVTNAQSRIYKWNP